MPSNWRGTLKGDVTKSASISGGSGSSRTALSTASAIHPASVSSCSGVTASPTSHSKPAFLASSWPPGSSTRMRPPSSVRSEEHTSELQSHVNLVCRLLLEKKKTDHENGELLCRG